MVTPSSRRFVAFALGVASAFLCAVPVTAFASTTDGTIDSTYRYAWSENAGWVDFGSAAGNVHVTDSVLTGSAYGENIGWITLNPPSYGGVTNNAEGTLSGYAWSENAGWIDFSKVTIGSDGIFAGNAYGENIGWITFGTGNNKVLTDWRPSSTRTPAPTPAPAPAPSSGGGGGGGGGVSLGSPTSSSDKLLTLAIVPSTFSLPAAGGPVTYTYTVTNTGASYGAVSRVVIVDTACSPVKYFSGDINNDTRIDINETWLFSCSANLTMTTRNIANVSGSASAALDAFTISQNSIVTVGASIVVPPTTNSIVVPSSGLSSTQISAILSLLSSFGADASVIANVQMALVGTREWTSGTITTNPASFTRDLKLGATGADVKHLQQFLITQDTGFASRQLSAVGASGYFGTLTQTALKEFQIANGITPPAGYFGPKTRDYIRNLTP